MWKKHKGTIFIVIGAVIAYFLFKKSTISLNPTTSSVLETVAQKRYPPPGYTGPTGGPFTWAGLGLPPDGKYTTIGYTANEAITAGIL